MKLDNSKWHLLKSSDNGKTWKIKDVGEKLEVIQVLSVILNVEGPKKGVVYQIEKGSNLKLLSKKQ